MSSTFAHMTALRQALVLVAVATCVACDRPSRAAARDSVAVAPATASDTVVRYVVRHFRLPTSMQRVTGVVVALSPDSPLDTALVIRVLDQRGDEMPRVPVKWTLTNAGAGAQLNVVNARTDSLGLAKATFTPGHSADPQIVGAEVRNVGRIDFAIAVPGAAIRIVPDHATIWSGDEVVVRAELVDAAGHGLGGGEVSWGSTDTSVLRARFQDPLHARVTGALAGTASVLAWIGEGTVRGLAPVLVRPVVTGRIMTMDGQPAASMRLDVRAGAVRDSIAVVNGQFSKRVDLPLFPDAETDVRADAPDAALYHQVHLRLASQRELQDLRIALVPRVWRIDAGSYQGRDVAIDAARAMQRTSRGSPFWRLVPTSGRGPRRLLGWRDADLPLRIAFNRARSNAPITAEDSVRFWTIAAQMERDLGTSLFVPADLRVDSGRVNVVPVEISAQSTEGHTFVSWGQPGNAGDGVLLFRQTSTLRDAHVVTHELLHLLGFGHTAGWTTVSQPIGGREPRLTPDDVAYVQLAMRLRRIQEQTGARPGLPIATQ
jgi:hypothetical protein